MIFILMGKSASGKDTIYSRLLEDEELGLVPYVIHTTRPMREGETDGVEYHFSDEKELEDYEKEGRLIECRTYDTVYGPWHYFTVDDGLDIDDSSYLYIGTLESYEKMRDFYGAKKVFPIYIEVEDGLRLERALGREKQREEPAYAEMCRRFLGDAEDFSEDKIAAAGIPKRYDNTDMEACLAQIRCDILKNL